MQQKEKLYNSQALVNKKATNTARELKAITMRTRAV